ncbi:hypothetical protein [Paenibacillus rhizophilus]|uniref:hypothetical protein n=1 Tax=Paenibacillus rhizophilus TaxID=1850366 RepID=UPI00163B0004|nr:hypothetical protein [Paenibacillus rhizophilus]
MPVTASSKGIGRAMTERTLYLDQLKSDALHTSVENIRALSEKQPGSALAAPGLLL